MILDVGGLRGYGEIVSEAFSNGSNLDRGWGLRAKRSVIGGGSANYSITALWTAARYEMSMVFLILKNVIRAGLPAAWAYPSATPTARPSCIPRK